MKEAILIEFDEQKPLFLGFADKCENILTELLKDADISVHFTTSRIKDRTSLSKKIESKKDKYTKLSDITDICGIRIVTFLESDVNRVAELLEAEFAIDIQNSIDKRKLRSDQFGYRSLHYVAALNAQRCSLSENKKYKSLKFEIQVRSILQHAWAEIEHDLGYKGAIAIPEKFKRNFNRLAALLETADVEFDRLKNDLTDYEHEVEKTIESDPDAVLIDQASIESFVKSNEVLSKASVIIAQNLGCEFYEEKDWLGELEKLEFFKIEYIGHLASLIKDYEKHFLSFVKALTKEKNIDELSSSIPLYYFLHFLAAVSGEVEVIEAYFNYGTIDSIHIDRYTAEHLLALFNESVVK